MTNPENKPHVNRKDRNKLNNNDWNLEWTTISDNHKHAYKLGLMIPPHQIPVKQFTKMKVFIRKYKSLPEAERKTGAFHANIGKCLTGERKTAGGFIWTT